ncbi:MAG TPA: hypothetical protein VK056_04265 [Bacillota bacterium]|nr:hypothetical protein [Bacillota bacterium]
MDLKVGIFGPEEIVKHAKRTIKAESNIELLPFGFQTPTEVNRLVDQAFMSDVYVFLDPLAYFYSKQTIDKKKLPVIKIFKDEYALATLLFQLISKYNHPPERFSIDVANKKYVENIFHDLEINHNSVYVSDYQNSGNICVDQIINFHRELWKDKKIDFVVTSSKYIHDQLAEENIPVYYIGIPKKYFNNVIKRAKELVHFNDHSIKRVVSGYIKLQDVTPNGKIPQSAVVSVHQLLKNYQSKISASLTLDSNNQFNLMGTRELLSYLTSHLCSLPLVEKIKERLPENINVHIGFGYGLTAKEAEENAQIALENSVKSRKSSCFIVNEREEVIGPIGIKRPFNKPKLYNKLIHKARLNNQISYNFIQFISARNNEPFSSEDIAQYYKVTKRSAERTIKKLVNGDIIVHVGEERPYIKGRPRKLFQLNDEILQ